MIKRGGGVVSASADIYVKILMIYLGMELYIIVRIPSPSLSKLHGVGDKILGIKGKYLWDIWITTFDE